MHLDNFIVSALLLLAVTSLAVALFRHLGLGSILGLLVAGVVVGPHSPGPYVTAQMMFAISLSWVWCYCFLCLAWK